MIELEVKDDWLERLIMERLGEEIHATETLRDQCNHQTYWDEWNSKLQTLLDARRILKGEW